VPFAGIASRIPSQSLMRAVSAALTVSSHWRHFPASSAHRFAPSVFVAVSDAKLEKKTAALSVYESQHSRLERSDLADDYQMPRLEPAYLCNRSAQARMYPHYDAAGNTVKDFGVLARVANPYAPGEHVVCAAGASGLGTRVALEFLADPGARPDVLKHFETRENVQVAFSAKPYADGMEVLDVHHD
jgi:hypothetical protein